ncbi:MAG: TolC family protein [Flavobacteriales bacterium]|nr:TolC family protein [Flavobacteriales bacterium]
MQYLSPVICFTLCIGESVLAQTTWTLQQCADRAVETNLAVRSAHLDRQIAGEDLRGANWGFLPDLNAAATHGYNWGQAIDRYTNTFATDRTRTNNFWLNSNWDLFRGLRQHQLRKRSTLDVQAAEEAIGAARVDVLTQVVARYMEMLSARENIEAAKQQAVGTRERIAFTQALVEAGRLARVDLLDLEAQLAREEFDVVSNENLFDRARLQMTQLLQLTAEESRAFDIATPSVNAIQVSDPDADLPALLERVLATHPAYQNARLQMESAERSIDITRTQLLPSLSFNASVATGYSGRDVVAVGDPIIGEPTQVGFTESGESVFTPNIQYDTETRGLGDQLDRNLNYSTSWTLSVPIFNQMSNRTAAAQARIRYEQARVRMGQQRLELELSVQQSLNDQRAAYRQFMAADRAMSAQQASLTFVEERFQQGTATALDLAIAKSLYQQAQARQIAARYAYLIAKKSLDIMQGLPLAL